jgi:glycosyltransferase involved in cell wall biosynthesis
MNYKPLVSVLMPAFNSEGTIFNSIMSILSQDYENWELIIINDCSTDSTLQIVKKFKDNRIKIINNSINSGVGFSRKVGFENSTGDFIAFLDSDDIWANNKVSMQLEYMLKNHYDFTITKVIKKLFNSDIILGKVIPPKHLDYKKLLWNTSIVTSSVLVKKSSISSDMFSTLRVGEDFLTWLNFLKRIQKVYLLDYYLVYYSVRKNSLSSNKIKAALNMFKIYKYYLKFDLTRTFFYFSLYSLSSLIKYSFSRFY